MAQSKIIENTPSVLPADVPPPARCFDADRAGRITLSVQRLRLLRLEQAEAPEQERVPGDEPGGRGD